MLTGPHRVAASTAPVVRQGGAVLLIAIIVVVIMMLAGIALVRSVYTTNLIAGNLAFQQSATHSGDTGVEAAITWLESNNDGSTLNSDDASNGYAADGLNTSHVPAAGQSWDAYWTQTLASRSRTLSSNTSGNTVSYVIDRLCLSAGSPTGGANCAASPLVDAATGNQEVAGKLQLTAPSLVYYRITARIAGPRETVSYVQAVVAL
jgi:type IV pilus assembly protein PilX